MFVSSREAAERLAVLGVDRESARRALLAGVAGEAVTTRSARLYPESTVDDLVARCACPLAPEEVSPQCQRGVFIGRLTSRQPATQDDWRQWRGADTSAPLPEQLLAASAWWRIALLTRIVIKARVEQDGFVPFVGTVSGFVVVGAEILGELAVTHSDREDATRLDLAPPGEWFAAFSGRRIAGPRGGPWYGWPDKLWSGLGRIAG